MKGAAISIILIDKRRYVLTPLETHPDIANRAYRFVKLIDGNCYDVTQKKNGHCTCECLGFLRWGHCKHISYVRNLTIQ